MYYQIHTSTLLKRFKNKSSAAQELEYWAQDSMMYTDGVYNSHYLNLLKKGKLVLEHFLNYIMIKNL